MFTIGFFIFALHFQEYLLTCSKNEKYNHIKE